MKPVYITAPLVKGTITPIKCKAPHTKRAKRSEVPPDYRRDRMKEFQDWLFYTKQDIKSRFKRRNYHV